MRLLPLLLLILTGCGSRAETVRIATFNSSLSREAPGELLAAVRTGDDAKAKAVAAVIQAARPDVLLLQEFDYDASGETLELFQRNYLAVAQQPNLEPIRYRHAYLAPSNTGVPTGVDLNGDGLVAPCEGAEVGTAAYAADCHGYGLFPGQGAFVILSRHPIDNDGIEAFGDLVWRDLEKHSMPYVYPADGGRDPRRLSSTNHVSVPVLVGDTVVRLLAAHPRFSRSGNSVEGTRNHDEIALLHGMALEAEEPFVIAGDLGADRCDGSLYRYQPRSLARFERSEWERVLFEVAGLQFVGNRTQTALPQPHAIESLLESELIWSNLVVAGWGGEEAARRDGGANDAHVGPPVADTADFEDVQRGNLRVDYVLPSADLGFRGGGIFWPASERPIRGVDLATVERASDHRLVWVDVRVE